MRLGARMLKTGAAVGICLYVGEWLRLEPILFMVIAAVLTTQPSIYRSYLHLLEQLQANTIGALTGIAGVALLGDGPIVVALSVILVIVINLFLRLESAIVLSIVTVIAVMAEPSGALNRFLLIMSGVLIALVVNAILMPPNHEKNLTEKIKSLNEKMLSLLRNRYEERFDQRYLRREKEEIEKELKKARHLYEIYREEKPFTRRQIREKKRKLVILREMIEASEKELQVMKTLRKEGSQPFATHLQEHIAALAKYHEIIYMKYEGRVKATAAHSKNMKIVEENRHLLEDIARHGTGLTSSHLRPFVLIAQLAELGEHLDHLDELVTSFLRFHNRLVQKPPRKKRGS